MNYLPLLFSVLFVIAILFVLFRNYFSKVTIPLVLPQEGFSVPVINSARGSLWFNIHNSAWPQFKLYDDHATVLILGRITIKYSDITLASQRNFIFPTLVLSVANVSWKIYLTMNRDNLNQVLSFLASKNCPIKN